MESILLQYEKARAFQKAKIKKYFAITTLVFVLAIAAFSIYLSMNPAAATRVLFLMSNNISSQLNIMQFLPALIENLFTSFLLIATGLIPFLFIPALIEVYFGGIIGIMIGATGISTITPTLIIAYMFPHGIILIPTMLLAASYGIYVCCLITRHIMHKERIHSFLSLIHQMMRAYILLIVPYIILATIIQVFITPLFTALF